MTELHITCGIQGSGKTTLAKKLSLNDNTALYIYDTFAEKGWNPALRYSLYEQIRQQLILNKNVIYDDMNLTIASREKLLSYFKDVDCKKIIHVMNTPLEVCLERHHKRAVGHTCLPDRFIQMCFKRYETPTIDEGWDEIIYHDYIKE